MLLTGLINLNSQGVPLLVCFIQHSNYFLKNEIFKCKTPLLLITLKKCEAKFIIMNGFLKLPPKNPFMRSSKVWFFKTIYT